MVRRRTLKLLIYAAPAAVLAVGPFAHIAGGGPVRAALCAEGGRRWVEIDFGGDSPDDERRTAPCHAAFLPDRKSVKPRGLR